MTKPDDSLLTHDQMKNVRRHADRLLRDAGALNVFPTPIDEIMAAAKLTVVEDELLDEGMLRKFMEIAKSGLATVKSAFSKIMALFESNDRLVVIDKNVPKPKRPFVKLHEAGHGCMPHQSKAYGLIQDCEKTLDPEITDLFEREANVFASEALFQGNVFTEMAEAKEFGVKIPMDLAKKFGASNYSAFRRYVATNTKACCVVVLDQIQTGDDGKFFADVRRIVVSKSFEQIIDPLPLTKTVDSSHPLGNAVPRGKQRLMSAREIIVVDRNGDERTCLVEAFNNTHQILVLLRETGLRKKTVLITPQRVIFVPAV